MLPDYSRLFSTRGWTRLPTVPADKQPCGEDPLEPMAPGSSALLEPGVRSRLISKGWGSGSRLRDTHERRQETVSPKTPTHPRHGLHYLMLMTAYEVTALFIERGEN